MNSTRWSSLTEFGKYLGREGICRVTETEKGMFIAWIDNSPEALARREAVKRREALERGDEQRERKELEAQVKRAQQALREREEDQAAKSNGQSEDEQPKKPLQEGQKIAFSLKVSKSKDEVPPAEEKVDSASPEASDSPHDPTDSTKAAPVKLSLGGLGTKPKPINVFKQQKSVLGKSKKDAVKVPPKKMTEMERIMKEEMERKRRKEEYESGGASKKVKLGT